MVVLKNLRNLVLLFVRTEFCRKFPNSRKSVLPQAAARSSKMKLFLPNNGDYSFFNDNFNIRTEIEAATLE